MTRDTYIKQLDRDIRKARLDNEVQHFFERWTPKDSRDAAQFQMEFHSVTRSIYADMQRPVMDTVESVLRTSMQSTPVIIDRSSSDD